LILITGSIILSIYNIYNCLYYYINFLINTQKIGSERKSEKEMGNKYIIYTFEYLVKIGLNI